MSLVACTNKSNLLGGKFPNFENKTSLKSPTPYLCPQHQQQVAAAVERAKQVTMQELNAIIGVG